MERAKVEFLIQEGYSIRQIAREMNRGPSTISRELARNYMNGRGRYRTLTAQTRYQERRRYSVKSR